MADAAKGTPPSERQHSPVPIPHHFQETDYTCGPSSIKMMLQAMLGWHVSEAALGQALRVDEAIGTRQRVLREYLLGLGLDVVERHTDTHLDEIRQLMADGRVVLVLYHLPGEKTDHYAVVARIGPNRILLQDPWHGPLTELPIREFDADWRTDGSVEGRRSRWMLAVKSAA